MNEPHRAAPAMTSIFRICLCGFFCLGLPVTAAPSNPPETGRLGGLFYSPEERLAMQRQRIRNSPTTAAPDSVQSVRLDGLVRRSAGSSTVWLNRRPMTTATAGALLGNARALDALHIGETLDPASGRRSDLLPGGSIEIRRRP